MFNKILLLLFSIFCSVNVYAENNEDKKIKTCKVFEELAGIAMTYRQSGAPMSGLYEKDFKSTDRNKVVRGLLREAYNKPRYFSKRVIEHEINEFKSAKFLECLDKYR